MKIKHLSQNTINKIAAGEVIERPASAVKELVENALDAGADKVQIFLQNSGKNLIKIIDNGCGMQKDDLEIAIKSHTTSKLNEQDLLDISTFGFRGEALSSIAAVARLSITSKSKDDDIGYKIEIHGGRQQGEIKESLAATGTIVEVRDLFFAVPARLKFLRSDRSELSAIVDVVKKIALAHPQTCITLHHESRKLLDLEKCVDSSKRINDIMSGEFASNSIDVNFKDADISITGKASLPTYTRGSASDQFLFINRRPIKDKMLMIALKIAYQDYIAPGRYPSAVIFVDIPARMVDFNVHPAKSEVRFQDTNLIKSLLVRALAAALNKHGQRVSSHEVDRFVDNFSPTTSPGGYVMESQQKFDHAPRTSSGGKGDYNSIKDWLNTSNNSSIFTPAPAAAPPSARGIEESDQFALGAARMQIFDCYIISQKQDSVIIVDQHAAHERIGYEKIKKQIMQEGLQKQALLIPEIVKLPSAEGLNILIEKAQELNKAGLEIERAADDALRVIAVPVIIGEFDIAGLIRDMADKLLELGQASNLDELIEHVTETYACHYSIRSGRRMNHDEIDALLREMERTPFSGQCNHGRPTYIELKKSDIEKLFGRK